MRQSLDWFGNFVMQPEGDSLFFALWPEEATRATLNAAAAHLRQRLRPVGCWVAAHRYHLPLHSLGDYAVYPTALVQRAIGAAATVRARRFELILDQAGSFRGRSIPWWIGPSLTPQPLKQLWRELRQALLDHSVPYDPKLRLAPHVTVLHEADQMIAATPVPSVRWSVDSFALIHSHVGAACSYRVLATWPLVTDCLPETPAVQRDLWETDAL